mmetsp:Transcript_96341/g.276644  ORF Transcript_96341/g.276644 Transcript_96341/m.276644 type:complete len:226 (+) Transcript_96341:1954-2631(+)
MVHHGQDGRVRLPYRKALEHGASLPGVQWRCRCYALALGRTRGKYRDARIVVLSGCVYVGLALERGRAQCVPEAHEAAASGRVTADLGGLSERAEARSGSRPGGRPAGWPAASALRVDAVTRHRRSTATQQQKRQRRLHLRGNRGGDADGTGIDTDALPGPDAFADGNGCGGLDAPTTLCPAAAVEGGGAECRESGARGRRFGQGGVTQRPVHQADGHSWRIHNG